MTDRSFSNIGNDATALWKHWDDSVDDKFLISRQQMHVSILSLCSFSGRLLSGMTSLPFILTCYVIQCPKTPP